MDLSGLDEYIERINNYNTEETNLICLIEEMAELTQVITKILRNNGCYDYYKVIEEFSHVFLMMNVFRKALFIEDEDILFECESAVKRLENKMNKIKERG